MTNRNQTKQEAVDRSITHAERDLVEESLERAKESKLAPALVTGTHTKVIEAATTHDPIQTAVFNLTKFDKKAFNAWLVKQPEAIKRSAMIAPPNAIYELPDGSLGYVVAYRKDGTVVVDMTNADLGLKAVRVFLAPDKLKDVTKVIKDQYAPKKV